MARAARVIGTALLFAGFAGAAIAQVKSTPPGADREGRQREVAKAVAGAVEASKERACDRTNAATLGSGEADLPIWEAFARCHAEKKEWDQAAADVRRATAIKSAPDELFFLRMDIDARRRNWAGLIETIELIARERPRVLNGIRLRFLWNLDTELGRLDQKALRARLLAVLASDRFKPTEFLASNQGFRRDYAIHLGATGRLAEARALVASLTSPWAVARVSLDPNLRSLFPADPDVRALAEAELARDSQAMRDNPDRLQAVIAVAADLEMLGRPQEALAVLQSVAGRIDDPKAFVDRDEQLPWWWDELSDVYKILGRYDDALDAMRKGGALTENGGANVSQVINLAHGQVGVGRYKEALETLAVFDMPGHDISPYGQIALREARACAHAFSGDMAAARRDVDYIRAHQKDAPGSIGSALKCLGDLDAAAAALIARVDDPGQRASALLGLSDYDDPPVKLPDQPLDKIEAALKARADLRAAIVRAGGTRRFNIQSS